MTSKRPKDTTVDYALGRPRVLVVSGATDGMGRELTLSRARRGDTVIALGSNPDKGAALLDAATETSGHVEFIRTDLSSTAQTRATIARISAGQRVIDALALFANRQAPKRVVTSEGFEQTFALYYLSRYLLSYELAPLLHESPAPVIINVAGVGARQGKIHWDDPGLEHGYGAVTAQLQAGRANDLLGVSFATRSDNPVRYVLYHPGFTRSGDLTVLPAALRVAMATAAKLFARPVERSVAPIHGFIDDPPAASLTAQDRDKAVPLSTPTLDPGDAERLACLTRELLSAN